jgi:cytidine deaminase
VPTPDAPPPTSAVPADLDPEDAKLVTLARASRARVQADEGAAVRDGTGRTYTATSVELASLRLSALQAAVAAAVSSGATTLEAAAVVSATAVERPHAHDRAVVDDLAGAATPILLAGPDGVVAAVSRGA